ASVISESSFTRGSPRNWRRHSLVAWASSRWTHLPTDSTSGLPVGRTIKKLSMKASSMGPCSAWRLARGLALAGSRLAGTFFLPTTSGEVFHRLPSRSEEHTSELQSQSNLVCRLLLEKKKKTNQ